MPIISGKYGFCFVCREKVPYCEYVCEMCNKCLYFCRKHKYEMEKTRENNVLYAANIRLGIYCEECRKTINEEEINHIKNIDEELTKKVSEFRSKYRSRL